MSFEELIQKWVAIDNQLKQTTDKIKLIRLEKNKMESSILNYVETNNLSKATINISDGKLKFINVKQTAPLTLKYVEECLKKCIRNNDQVQTIMTYIKDERNEKYVPDIKRYYSS
jgi:hypothetical protein